MNYVTIISNVDGAIDAFNTDEAIFVDPIDTKSFSNELIRAVNMNNITKKDIINRNETSIKNFDFREIMKDFIIKSLK
jgi:trehalose-6-phosphate synthase